MLLVSNIASGKSNLKETERNETINDMLVRQVKKEVALIPEKSEPIWSNTHSEKVAIHFKSQVELRHHTVLS